MKLEELLQFVGKEYLDDRTDLVDGESDSLWSDELITRHLNEAQRVLCRRSWVLIDTGNTTAGVITLVTGKTLYPLHKSILRVYDATYEGDTAPLGRAHASQIRSRAVPDTDAFADINGLTAATPGRPLAIATDDGTRTLRLDRAPSATEAGMTLTLKVARMPVCMLDPAKPGESPEVPEEWHMALATYAAGRCLTMPNVDSDGKTEGRRLLAEWDDAVRLARQERVRSEYAPGEWQVNTTTALV